MKRQHKMKKNTRHKFKEDISAHTYDKGIASNINILKSYE